MHTIVVLLVKDCFTTQFILCKFRGKDIHVYANKAKNFLSFNKCSKPSTSKNQSMKLQHAIFNIVFTIYKNFDLHSLKVHLQLEDFLFYSFDSEYKLDGIASSINKTSQNSNLFGTETKIFTAHVLCQQSKHYFLIYCQRFVTSSHPFAETNTSSKQTYYFASRISYFM